MSKRVHHWLENQLIPSFFKYYIFIDSIPYVNILYGWLKQTQMLCFRLVSLISCLGATIKFTGHTFAVAGGVAVAAIVLVWFLSMSIPVVVCFPWKMIKVIVPFLWKMIFRTGKTMKAPGRNYRILRATFERNPAAYFRNLRSGLWNMRVWFEILNPLQFLLLWLEINELGFGYYIKACLCLDGAFLEWFW